MLHRKQRDFGSPFNIRVVVIMILFLSLYLLEKMISPSQLVTRTEHQRKATKLKKLMKNLSYILHVLVGEKVMLQVVLLLFMAGILLMVCQFERNGTIERFTIFFIRRNGVPEVCITREKHFTEFSFENLIRLYHFVVKSLSPGRFSVDQGIKKDLLLNLR